MGAAEEEAVAAAAVRGPGCILLIAGSRTPGAAQRQPAAVPRACQRRRSRRYIRPLLCPRTRPAAGAAGAAAAWCPAQSRRQECPAADAAAVLLPTHRQPAPAAAAAPGRGGRGQGCPVPQGHLRRQRRRPAACCTLESAARTPWPAQTPASNVRPVPPETGVRACHPSTMTIRTYGVH